MDLVARQQLFFSGVVLLCHAAISQELASPPANAGRLPVPLGSSGQAVNPTATQSSGDRMLADTIRSVSSKKSIAARIRHRVDLFDRHLVGSGTYRQLRIGDDVLLRYELAIPIGDQVTSLQQICDSRFLWIRRSMPDPARPGNLRSVIDRIDLTKRTVASEFQPRFSTAMGRGGLPQLMEVLSSSFRFVEVSRGELHETPVWISEGFLRRESTGPNAESERIRRLTPQMPDAVRLTVGMEDLFPYQIQYRRTVKGETDESAPSSRPLLTMEFFEVQLNVDLDVALFDYRSGDLDVTDQSRNYLEQLVPSPIRRAGNTPATNVR